MRHLSQIINFYTDTLSVCSPRRFAVSGTGEKRQKINAKILLDFLPKITSVLIAAVITLPGAAIASPFEDVLEGQWYYDAVTQAVSMNLIQGYPDGRFYPNRAISCAEFVTITARAKSLTAAPKQGGHWAADIMSDALNAGWYDWDEIPPTGELFDLSITRKIAARILWAAFIPDVRGGYSKWSGEIRDFRELDGRYYEPVFALYEAGLAVGDEKGNFNPNKGLTRAEACALIVRACTKDGGKITEYVPEAESTVQAVKGGVSENGSLRVIGTQLCSENGSPVVLRGMSSHGMQWYGDFASKGAIKTTRDYGANVFRAAMYTGEGGYISDKSIKNKVFEAIDAAIALDMYAVIDWHILSDGNPQTHLVQAKDFFAEASERYAGNPAVIYEICNEPNGQVTWERDIRPYAMEIIPVIRGNSPDAIVLVGSGTWSQDIHTVVSNPLPFDNVMYTLHYYAGTHSDGLRERLVTALENGTPVFVSEWGTSDASGGGGVYLEQAEKWLDLLDKRGISWINWSLCDKNESSAALKPGASPAGGWTENDLSESGRFVFARFI